VLPVSSAEMIDRKNSNRSYRAMVGKPRSVIPAWRHSFRRSLSEEPLPGRGTRGLDLIHAAQSLEEFLWSMARDAVEDIATLRRHRIAEPHETWRDPDRAEQRLLNQIDAVVNCGEQVIDKIVDVGEKLETPDPDWIYAVILVLGCLKEERALDQAATLLRLAAERDPEELEAATEALCLVPHPDVGRMLSPLLSDSSAVFRAAAVTVLSYRGSLLPDVALRLLSDPFPEVIAATIEGFVRMDGAPALPSIRVLVNHGDEAVVRASLRFLFRARVPEGRARALAVCGTKPEFAEACLILGLSGVQQDFAVLDRLLTEARSAMAVCAAGYFGDVRLVPRLIELLTEDKLKLSAAKALYRMTSAILVQGDSELKPWLVVDPVPWKTWWEASRARFSPERRYRLGRPYGPSALLLELDQSGDRVERARAYLEFCRLANANVAPFRPLDFIPNQEESLKALGQWASANSSLDTGRWSAC
jgi:hypothetical protein